MKQLLVIQNAAHERGDNLRLFLHREQIAHQWRETYIESAWPSVNETSALIVLGSPRSVNRLSESSADQRLFAFVAAALRADLPYLGICYGAQLLARLLGAVVEPYVRKEIGGGHAVTLTEAGASDPLLAGFPNTFPVFHWHGETFKIPHGATFLGQGSDCPNQIFRKGKAAAVQFHLDTGADEAANWCEAAPLDLADAGKTKAQVVFEYAQIAASSRQLNDLMIRNFLRQAST